ncbi:aspartyl protease family protein At5g10770-like [Lolium rigidum]|uniref:aspartyl protease family protein At5g10770-like n=1 Tax=Lolium rigidum TaxID=89674 RepID=UPI001F5D6D45|nr:aspartyl protease family protein At5g10770-like [Lolium rigidum]
MLSSGKLGQRTTSTGTVRLTLLHREHPCSPVSMRPVDRSSLSISALPKYHANVRRLAGRLSSCPTDQVNTSGPILANGIPWDYYSYVTQIQLGTPAKTHNVLVDTGSSLSWVGCEPCSSGCLNPVFDPDASSTYNVVRCRSSLCNRVPSATISRNTCILPFQKCSYNQTYKDDSMSVGLVSSDRLMYGREEMQGFIFGCCNSFSGIGGQYSGILGLSVNKLSFFSQITLSRRYRAMSYCLPHPHKEGFLQFGQYSEHHGLLSFTPLFIDGNQYYVQVSNIMVGTASLDAQSNGNQTTRCFFDTGTPYTMLPGHLFDSLIDAVSKRMLGYYRVGASTGQTCFHRENFWDEEDMYIPTVRIMFRDGARITLVSEDLMFVEHQEVYCLAFKRNDGSDMVLGSRHLMAVHTVVDLEKMTMGLRDQGCI